MDLISKEIGKITKVYFGFGGYDNAMIGISFMLAGPAWGCGDFWGYWSGSLTPNTQWTEDDRQRSLGETVMRISALLSAAKVKTVNELDGKPIEATFHRGRLQSWRILEEVL